MTPKDVNEIVKSKAGYLAFNYELIDIFENNLCGYIEKDMAAQLSPQSFEQARFRISPINILPKVIDKLTNIYQTSVIREVVDGTPSDKELLSWYEQEMGVNDAMNSANEMFNLCKGSLIYPCVQYGNPKLMIIENDRFVPYASDPMYPTKVTHVILLGDKIDGVDIYWVWTATQFFVCDSNEKMRHDIMAQFGNPDGINPIGRLPFVYVNESKRKILPKQDSDMLKIIKLIPVMLSDLNLAAMFQSFAIVYGINIDDENIKYAPNAFWRLKSDPTSDAKPEIGTIKPQVDYDQVLGLIEAQLSMWLGTKGIRASTVGALTKDNFASGISKIIDEMDTFEARQKQVTKFVEVEDELWDLILNHMHPYWVAAGMIENIYSWSGAEVKTVFAVQLPMQSRGQIVRDVKDEYAAGFTSRKRAVSMLNPDMSSEQIDELIEEIDEERNAGQPTEDSIGNPNGPQTKAEIGTGGPDSGAYS